MPEMIPSPTIPSPSAEKTDPAIRIMKTEMKTELNWQGAKLTIAMVVVAVGTAFGAYTFLMNQAHAQTDAGILVETAQRVALEVRVQTLEKRFDHYEAKQDRQDQNLDLALDALHVPRSARPPPVPPMDGGL